MTKIRWYHTAVYILWQKLWDPIFRDRPRMTEEFIKLLQKNHNQQLLDSKVYKERLEAWHQYEKETSGV